MKTKLLRKWRTYLKVINTDPQTGKEDTTWILKGWNAAGIPFVVTSGTFEECLKRQHEILGDYIKIYESRKNRNNICNRLLI